MRFSVIPVGLETTVLRFVTEVSFSLAMDFFLALALSFLPQQYRNALAHKTGTHLVRAACITAFFEIILVAVLYAAGLFDYFPKASIGPAAFLEFFFTWKGLLLALFFLDGTIRLLASIAGQALGTLPVYALAWIHGLLNRRAMHKRKLPLVADLVEQPKDNELRILSCLPRKNWDKWMTVLYDENLYEVFGAELASDPRPYVYLLRIKPESKVIRGLHRYNPDEVFHLEND